MVSKYWLDIVHWYRKKCNERKTRKFLEKRGYRSLTQYRKHRDPFINNSSSYVLKKFYYKYKYVVPLYSTASNIEYVIWDFNKNVKRKSRYDLFRVLDNVGSPIIDDYLITDLGNADMHFFAFTDEKEYMWFKLKHG